MSISNRNYVIERELKRKNPNWDQLNEEEKKDLKRIEIWRFDHPIQTAIEDLLIQFQFLKSLPQCLSPEYRKYTIVWTTVIAIAAPALYLIYDGIGRGDLVKYFLWVFIVLLLGATIFFTTTKLNQCDKRKSKSNSV